MRLIPPPSSVPGVSRGVPASWAPLGGVVLGGALLLGLVIGLYSMGLFLGHELLGSWP